MTSARGSNAPRYVHKRKKAYATIHYNTEHNYIQKAHIYLSLTNLPYSHYGVHRSAGTRGMQE